MSLTWHFHDRHLDTFCSEAIQEKLAAQIKDVEAAQAKEVPLSWVGVAEVSS